MMKIMLLKKMTIIKIKIKIILIIEKFMFQEKMKLNYLIFLKIILKILY